LLHEILSSPDEDLPRLVYADWLEEHGDADRAEFIRVQCALARLPAYDPDAAELEQRAQELLLAHQRRGAGPTGARAAQLGLPPRVPRTRGDHPARLPGQLATALYPGPGPGGRFCGGEGGRPASPGGLSGAGPADRAWLRRQQRPPLDRGGTGGA